MARLTRSLLTMPCCSERLAILRNSHNRVNPASGSVNRTGSPSGKPAAFCLVMTDPSQPASLMWTHQPGLFTKRPEEGCPQGAPLWKRRGTGAVRSPLVPRRGVGDAANLPARRHVEAAQERLAPFSGRTGSVHRHPAASAVAARVVECRCNPCDCPVRIPARRVRPASDPARMPAAVPASAPPRSWRTLCGPRSVRPGRRRCGQP